MEETGLQIFKNEKFGTIRTTLVDDEPWFVAADVCGALDIGNPTMALARLDEDEKALISIEGLSRGNDLGNIVSESGLYTLILGSRKKEARTFKRWITHEVIPTIRKHGAYMTPETVEKALLDPDFLIRLATELKDERQKRTALEKENKILAAQTLKWVDKDVIHAMIRRYASQRCNGVFAYGWTEYKKELLYKHGININTRITMRMNESGKKTKPATLDMLETDELPSALSTAVAMCRNANVDVSDLLEKAVG